MDMHISLIFFILLLLLSAIESQRIPSDEDSEESASNEVEYANDEHYEKELLVIANQFPKELNFFCNPRNELMRDRICYGQLDTYALSCADDNPPLHLVPFCFAFKHHCSLVTYPSDDWCVREFDRYDDYCTRTRKSKCKSCSYDLSCYCEPYECLWKRFGYNTAVWCQRYELFCDAKARRRKATELVILIEHAVKIHYKCMHLFNLPKVICDPFRRQFDYNRCIKFLFDCELISDFDDEMESPVEEISPEEAPKEEETSNKTLTPSPEEKKQAEEIAEKEMALEELIKEKEKEDKKKHGMKPTQKTSSSNSTTPINQESTHSVSTSSVSTSSASTLSVAISSLPTSSVPTPSILGTTVTPPKNPFEGITLW